MKLFSREVLSPQRLHSIDALRGVAALSVVLYHAVGQAVERTPPPVPASWLHWLIASLSATASLGYAGVYLFFVISGFCIHLRWAKARAAGQTAAVDFVTFWKRRLRRLYPPYLVALLAYLAIAMLSTGVPFFWWNVGLHLTLLHNLDTRTSYGIASVFWTLAIEEQLYLAYFLLLRLRERWGWHRALLCCALVRIAWFFLGAGAQRFLGVEIPVSESAAAYWVTWALGAVGVEAALGLIPLPGWCRNAWLGAAALLAAAGLTHLVPLTAPDGLAHTVGWLLVHPVWSLGFFIVVNRLVFAENLQPVSFRARQTIRWLAAIGLFSYSLYLTHPLVLLQTILLNVVPLPPLLLVFVIVVPATVIFAWLFFLVCERPFMTPPRAARLGEVTAYSRRARSFRT